MATPTYTKAGAKATTAAKLPKEVFGVEVKSHDLLKQAYVAYLANGRTGTATTKTRGEVRGGGKKPWRQKGTGRARFGSIRVPIWRGGGITFGPTGEQNYKQELPLKAKRQAIRQALSLASDAGKIKVVETLDFKDGKTAATHKFLNKIEATGNVLVVVDVKDEAVSRAVNNLPKVKAVQATYLNTYDIMNADSIVMSQKALEMVTAWLSSTAKAKDDKGGKQ